MITAVLMAACCSITYFCITKFAPYIYTHDFSTIDEEVPYFVEDISHFTKEEALFVIEDYCNQIVEKNDDEFVFRLFQSDSEELKQFHKNDTSQWCRLTFTDSTDEYIVFFSKNTEKESQVVEALKKAIPVLSVVIIAVSVIAAFFYTIYMTTPIKKISRISKQMAALDFSGLCTVRRTDEIGVLAGSLNDLSRKLSSALSELQSANQKLQADIDMERQLERQRVEFFSAASHELKTPITIIKGQLQGMLYQVGRYRDRETYLARSLEVTDTLEKMVQELLTISRLNTPGYVFNPSHIHLDELIQDRLAANEDLFMQQAAENRKAPRPPLTPAFAYFPLPAAGEKQQASGTNKKGDPEPRRAGSGTNEDYQSLLNLKTSDYAGMSIADFNAKLLAWADEDFSRAERVDADLLCNDFQVSLSEEELEYIRLTVFLSGTENGELVQSNYTGDPAADPSFGIAQRLMICSP